MPNKLCLLSCLLLSACVLDFEDVGPSGGGGSGGGSQNAGAPSAGGGDVGGNPPEGGGGSPPTDCKVGTCFAVPPGFEGAGVRDTDCQGDLLFRAGASDATYTTPLAECTCECLLPASLGCPALADSAFHLGANCSDFAQIVSLAEDECVLAQSESASIRIEPSMSTPVNGFCQSDMSPPTLDPVEFDDPISLCSLSERCTLPGGGEGVCLSSNMQCFYGPEGASCPMGFNTTTILRFPEDFDDNRDCGCSCGPAEGSCVPHFRIFEDTNCTNGQRVAVSITNGECTTASETFRSVIYDPQASEGCNGEPNNPVGEVTPKSLSQLCCLAE